MLHALKKSTQIGFCNSCDLFLANFFQCSIFAQRLKVSMTSAPGLQLSLKFSIGAIVVMCKISVASILSGA